MAKKAIAFKEPFITVKKEVSRQTVLFTNKVIALKGVDINVYKNIRRISINIAAIEKQCESLFGNNITSICNSDTTLQEITNIISSKECEKTRDYIKYNLIQSLKDLNNDLVKYYAKGKDLSIRLEEVKI